MAETICIYGAKKRHILRNTCISDNTLTPIQREIMFVLFICHGGKMYFNHVLMISRCRMHMIIYLRTFKEIMLTSYLRTILGEASMFFGETCIMMFVTTTVLYIQNDITEVLLKSGVQHHSPPSIYRNVDT